MSERQESGKTLRQLREQARLSQEDLAAKAQVSRASIQNWEANRTAPRRAEMNRLASALGLTDLALRARLVESNDDEPAREANFARNHQAQYVEKIAAKLRDMAEEVERAGSPRADGTPYPPGVIAGRVSHIIAWGVANLNVESLVTNIDDIYAVDALLAEEATSTEGDTQA
jgi:transcriptional regulator with XRE-family HTH domain